MPRNKDAFRIGDYFLGKRRNSDHVVRLPVRSTYSTDSPP